VVSWVLKKPMLEHRKAIDDSIHRAVLALPLLLTGEMEKAMVKIHTSKPPRPKPPRPPKAEPAPTTEPGQQS
jgi:PTH1 family peptidyl-tRNA hydrolase